MVGFTPAYLINVGGQNVTSIFAPHLISLEVNDEEGTQSDTFSVTLDDPGGIIRLPRKGDPASCALGYLESGIFPMGNFTVDTVNATGFPRQVVISCKSADMNKDKKQQRTKSWPKDTTLKSVLEDVAKRHGRTLKLVGDFSELKLPSWHQDTESDLHFTTRLGHMFDANASWKGNQLIFVKKGLAPPGVVNITLADLVDSSAYSLDLKGRSDHKDAQAESWDRAKAKKDKQKQSGGGSGNATSGLTAYQHGGPDLAKATAKAQADKLKRDEKNLSLTCVGDPQIMAEMDLNCAGIRDGIDGEPWRIKKAAHSLSSGTFQTTIEAELKK